MKALWETVDIRYLDEKAQWFFEQSDQGALADLFGKCSTIEDINKTAADLWAEFHDED